MKHEMRQVLEIPKAGRDGSVEGAVVKVDGLEGGKLSDGGEENSAQIWILGEVQVFQGVEVLDFLRQYSL